MSVFVYVCVHKYAHVHICRVHMCVGSYICVYVHLYVYACVFVHAYSYVQCVYILSIDFVYI